MAEGRYVVMPDHIHFFAGFAEHYEEKWQYVLRNPERHELVACWEDWPYKGEIHLLRWD